MAKDTKTPAEWVADARFQTLTESTDDDADSAASEQKTLLASGEVKRLGSGVLAEYKADGARLDKAREAFDAARDKALAGGGDLGALLGAYQRYGIALTALEAQNVRFQALADARVCTMAAAIATFLTAVLFDSKKRVVQFEVRLKKLAIDMKRAEKAVAGAKLQRQINTCISAATLLVAPTGVLARVLVAGGSATLQLGVDYALGSSKGGGASSVVTVLGGASEGVDRFGQAAKKFSSAGAGLLGFKFDSDEIGEAEAIVKALRADLDKTCRELDDLLAVLEPLGKKARTLKDGMVKANAAAMAAESRSRDARDDYVEMRQLLG